MKNFNINVDDNAIVSASSNILIDADSQTVMKVLSDIKNWTAWRSDINYVRVKSNYPIKENSQFVWKSNGLTYKSTVHTCTSHLFGWTGKTIGAFAIHNWQLTDEGNQTRVQVAESLSGIAIRLMRNGMKSNLPKLMVKDLTDLKLRGEIAKS
ncbi:SRPBCC family protein [Lactobacillus sp. ESL0677]|uniref:SRPBCC family protein n=1 Tax=Lactobacillus sp. ESL0677 TaxID=2983208 RepID=UPI0023F81945|nr:SRPBCC family protein [Lactobacillus sp. ESL0677]WEV36292.1 SRPBCC family protein [Lactobacillus sp. ESL0677]